MPSTTSIGKAQHTMIWLSNQASGVCKAHYLVVLWRKSSILLAGTGVRKIHSVACGFSPVKIHFSAYLNSLISRINEVYIFQIKYRYFIGIKPINFISNHLFCWNHTCYCVGKVSVTSASSFVTPASRYQSRFSMNIQVLNLRNSTELAEAVPIASSEGSDETVCKHMPVWALAAPKVSKCQSLLSWLIHVSYYRHRR